MKITAYLQRHGAWVNMSTATLVALLQRTPLLRVAAVADEFMASSPFGTLLKSAAVAAASLGTIDSMAGATVLATNLTPSPSGNLPTLNATVGVAIAPVGFTITNALNIGSWTVTGQIPPGLVLTTKEPNGGSLTGPGNLDATTPGSSGDPWTPSTSGNTQTTPILEGTPTAAGSYTFNLQGFALGGEKGGNGGTFVGTGISAIFPFTVVVASVASAPPSFTTQPLSVSVTGGSVAFDAFASNATSYQWMWNGSTPVSGAISPILLISNAAASAGTYTCVATNGGGSVTSNPATLSITSTNDIGRLVNISCRSGVGTGSNILIAGFVSGGAGTSGTQPVLIRGTGPALAAFGVAGTLADPQLQLYKSNSDGSSALLQTNAGWGGSASITTEDSAVGAFALTNPSSLDSALYVPTLAAGGYTAQIAGASGDTGVSLAEVYDATPAGTYTPASPRIINISARVQVGTGTNILIAGFVIGGSTARTVLVRASGPALAAFGVSGTLADPQLKLYKSNPDGSSTFLESNNGWGGDASIRATAPNVGAFAWTNSTSADSALLVTLPPGGYTAQVSGFGGDSGVALVELYEVP